MVRIIEDSNNKKDRFVERLFLISLKKWCPEGVECTISKVGKLFEDKTHKQKVTVIETDGKKTEKSVPKTKVAIKVSVLGDMPHIRANKLDENGQYIMDVDEFEGTKKAQTETIDNPTDVDVTFFHNLIIRTIDKNEDIDNQEYVVNNKSKLFPLLNFAFIKSGEVPADNTNSLGCTYNELFDALTDLKFIATMDSWKIPGGKPYPVLIPKDSVLYADEYDIVAEPVTDTPKKEETKTESKSSDMDVEDFDDLDKIPKQHLDYLGKRNPYIKEALTTLDAGNVPLTQQKLIQELSFMVTDKAMSVDDYNQAKDLVFATLA